MFPEVSCIIPGASRPDQVVENVKASQADPLRKQELKIIEKVYSSLIKDKVHHLW